MRLRILDKVAGSVDLQRHGGFLSAAAKFSALVCGPRVSLLAERVHENVSVEAGFGLFDSGVLGFALWQGRWLVCPESVGFTAALM